MQRRFAVHLAILLVLAGFPPALLAQETENITPPPVLYAHPHLNIDTPDGSDNFLGGVDVGLWMPISFDVNLSASHYFNAYGSGYSDALLNYDHLLADDTLLRTSAGMIRDEFGYGVTIHRDYDDFGVGAFAENVDGDWQGGLMVTRRIDWGVKLSRPLKPEADTRWTSSGGSVGSLGARAGLVYRDTDAGTLISTRPYFLPEYRHSWPRAGGGAQSTFASGEHFPPPAHLVWEYEADGPVRTAPAVNDGVAYIGSQDGWLYALDLQNGTRRWRFPANSPITTPPTFHDGHIYFGTEAGELFCVKAPAEESIPAGQLAWRFQTEEAITSSPLVTGAKLVFFGSASGRFYALKATDGSVAWSKQTEGPIVAGASKAVWSIPAGIDENVNPTQKAGAILCASTDGTLYAFGERTGETIWKLDTGAPLTAAPAIFGQAIYAGNYAGQITALTVSSGHIRWTERVAGRIVSSPSVDRDHLVVITRGGDIYALDTADGSERWRRSLPAAISSSATLVQDSILYVPSRDGYMRALSMKDGEVVWQHFIGEPLATSPTIAEKHLVVGGERAGVYAYRKGKGKSIQLVSTSKRSPAPNIHEELPQDQAKEEATPPQPSQPDDTPSETATEKPQDAPQKSQQKIKQPPADFPAPSTKPGKADVNDEQATEHEAEAAAADQSIQQDEPVAENTAKEAEKTATDAATDKPSDTATDAAEAVTSAPAQEGDGAHLTLLTDPTAGDEPLLVSNRSFIFIGGTIDESSPVATFEVNGTPVSIEDGRFLHRETFPGPGMYLVRMEATSPQGASSERVRRVRVLGPGEVVVPDEVYIHLSPDQTGAVVTLTAGTADTLPGASLVVEIHTPNGRVIQRWRRDDTSPAHFYWFGTDLEGNRVKPGESTLVVALRAGDEIINEIRQPLQIRK